MSKIQKVSLLDTCTINMGQSPESSTYNQEGEGLPFFQGKADFGELYPSVRYYCSGPKKIAQKGDLLLSVRAPIGALNIATEECCIGRGLAALTAKPAIDTKYLYYALFSLNNELNARGTGSTFKAINKQDLAEVSIPLPSLQKQQRISTTLDVVSEVLRLRKAQLAELDNLVKSQFIEMFGAPDTNPKGWDADSIGHLISDITAGCSVNGEARVMNPGEKAVLKVSAVTAGVFRPDEYKVISNLTEVKKYVSPMKGDLLFSRANTKELVGATALVDHDYPDLMLPDKLWRITPTSRIDRVYLKQTLSSDAIRSVISSSSTGTSGSMYNVSMEKLCNIVISVPPLDIQTRFADFVQQADKSKLAIHQSLDETQRLFDSLMAEYFED